MCKRTKKHVNISNSSRYDDKEVRNQLMYHFLKMQQNGQKFQRFIIVALFKTQDSFIHLSVVLSLAFYGGPEGSN